MAIFLLLLSLIACASCKNLRQSFFLIFKALLCPDQTSGLQSWTSLYPSATYNTNITIPSGTLVLFDANVTINTLTIDGTVYSLDCISN